MQITYSFVDTSDNYVGHAESVVTDLTSVTYKVSTRPVTTIKDALDAQESLVCAMAKRFPHWEHISSAGSRLVADNFRGNSVRVVTEWIARGES